MLTQQINVHAANSSLAAAHPFRVSWALIVACGIVFVTALVALRVLTPVLRVVAGVLGDMLKLILILLLAPAVLLLAVLSGHAPAPHPNKAAGRWSISAGLATVAPPRPAIVVRPAATRGGRPAAA